MEAHGAGLRRLLVLAFCVVGIWSAYIYQGVLQEILYVSLSLSLSFVIIFSDDAIFSLKKNDIVRFAF